MENMPTTVIKLQKQISKLNKQIIEIQEQCNHPFPCVEKIPESNAGGYDDPMYNEYWYRCHCLLCDKRWTEEQ